MKLKKGLIVRYGTGPTTLCRLVEARAGGWNVERFDGTPHVVTNSTLLPASKEEVQAYLEEARKRKK